MRKWVVTYEWRMQTSNQTQDRYRAHFRESSPRDTKSKLLWSGRPLLCQSYLISFAPKRQMLSVLVLSVRIRSRYLFYWKWTLCQTTLMNVFPLNLFTDSKNSSFIQPNIFLDDEYIRFRKLRNLDRYKYIIEVFAIIKRNIYIYLIEIYRYTNHLEIIVLTNSINWKVKNEWYRKHFFLYYFRIYY